MSAGVPSPLPGPLEAGALERRYRRLLGLYPPSWRAGRLEEVLAVLLACAEPDRSWPAVRDGADLVRHALAERVRLAGRSVSSDDRRSGVALAGIVAFALLAALSVLQLIVLVPNPDAWAAAGYRFFSSGPALAMLASALCLVAGGLWLARIRRLALENGVPIVEKKPLAQLLYKEVDINHPVPAQMYAAVAEVLAYVYQLKGKTMPAK